MNDKGYKVWDGSKSGELNFMDNLSKKFIENGYGVVIGEFGATNKDNLEDRVAWAKDYCGKAASLGIFACVGKPFRQPVLIENINRALGL